MGIYSRYVFPWIIDKVMAREVLMPERQRLLADARGNVLEIGFGTGLNLAFYPESIEHLTVVDPNPGMHTRAAKRIAESKREIMPIRLGIDARLPVAADSFDTVVSTWTMCSIPDLTSALAEIARVLKPGGRFLFIEHGLSPDPKIARWQNRLNPINKWIGDGCNLNRNFAALLEASPLALDVCDQFSLPDTPRVAAWTYRGMATRHSAVASATA